MATNDRLRQQLEQPTRAGDRGAIAWDGIDYPLRWCPPGTFMMGSAKVEQEEVVKHWLVCGYSQEQADTWAGAEIQHEVTLTTGFWLLETAVTQEMYVSVVGHNPSNFTGSRLPVEHVSFDEANGFIRKLNERFRAEGGGGTFHLPTEAQWEYACRAGTTTPYSFGTSLNGDRANCNGNYPYGTAIRGANVGRTTMVGSYPANPWGLYDMHGNVWEWCSDSYGEYPSGPVTDPERRTPGGDHVIRGGSWTNRAGGCRSAHRFMNTPGGPYDGRIGFRVALRLS